MKNRSIFDKKDGIIHPLHSSKQDRLDRQIITVFISFGSFFKPEHAQPAATRKLVSYNKPNVQQVQKSEQKHIFHYTLIWKCHILFTKQNASS